MFIRFMHPRSRCRRRSPIVLGVPGLAVLGVLAGCATGTPPGNGGRSTFVAGYGAPSHYAQATDSATNGCLRNPACYGQTGEDAIIPWLSRAASAARTATTMAKLLADAEVKAVEQGLIQCAKEAKQKVLDDDKELQGQDPTREQCKKVVRMEGGKEITRAMELGSKMHALALACVRSAFADSFAKNVSVEPTYQQDPSTGSWLWIDPKKVAEWLQLGLKSQLWGALVPDIVLHASGNPNQIQNVYDFKFPCPSSNEPSWRSYTRDQPHYPSHQGAMYKDALLGGKSNPKFVTRDGVK